MTKHLTDGQLRAALDGEAEATERAHLDGCADCQQRQRAIHAQTQRVAASLAFLVPNPQDAAPSPQKALRRFQQERIAKEIPMFKRLFASSVFRFAAIGVLLIALTLSFPQTRALADQFLSLFRVQQVKVVYLDFTGMQELTGQGLLGEQISQLLSTSMVVTKRNTKPVTVADAAQASQQAGFDVRLPQGKTPSQLRVMSSSAFTFTIDREKAQALLDEAGRGDLVLPASINGKEVSVSIPAAVSAAYGTCPAGEGGTEAEFNSKTTQQRYADCTLFAQIPSPTVSAPDGLDVGQLVQIGLEFTGMSHEEAAAFTNSVDWTSTLVIPLPRHAASYEQVEVDGVMGTLIVRMSDDGDTPSYSLIWVKNGIIYAVGGAGTNTASAVKLANSLP